MREDASQRRYDLREVFNVLRWIIHTGAVALPAGRFPVLGGGLPSSPAVDRLRCLRGDGVRSARVAALCAGPQHSALGGHVRQLHAAIDAIELAPRRIRRAQTAQRLHAARPGRYAGGDLLPLLVTPTNAQNRKQVAADVAEQGIRWEVVKLEEAKRGFALPPQRWVIERSFAWAARFRRLAKDDERLPEVFVGPHFLTFLTLLRRRLLPIAGQSP
jgi:transposase